MSEEASEESADNKTPFENMDLREYVKLYLDLDRLAEEEIDRAAEREKEPIRAYEAGMQEKVQKERASTESQYTPEVLAENEKRIQKRVRDGLSKVDQKAEQEKKAKRESQYSLFIVVPGTLQQLMNSDRLSDNEAAVHWLWRSLLNNNFRFMTDEASSRKEALSEPVESSETENKIFRTAENAEQSTDDSVLLVPNRKGDGFSVEKHLKIANSSEALKFIDEHIFQSLFWFANECLPLNKKFLPNIDDSDAENATLLAKGLSKRFNYHLGHALVALQLFGGYNNAVGLFEKIRFDAINLEKEVDNFPQIAMSKIELIFAILRSDSSRLEYEGFRNIGLELLSEFSQDWKRSYLLDNPRFVMTFRTLFAILKTYIYGPDLTHNEIDIVFKDDIFKNVLHRPGIDTRAAQKRFDNILGTGKASTTFSEDDSTFHRTESPQQGLFSDKSQMPALTYSNIRVLANLLYELCQTHEKKGKDSMQRRQVTDLTIFERVAAATAAPEDSSTGAAAATAAEDSTIEKEISQRHISALKELIEAFTPLALANLRSPYMPQSLHSEGGIFVRAFIAGKVAEGIYKPYSLWDIKDAYKTTWELMRHSIAFADWIAKTASTNANDFESATSSESSTSENSETFGIILAVAGLHVAPEGPRRKTPVQQRSVGEMREMVEKLIATERLKLTTSDKPSEPVMKLQGQAVTMRDSTGANKTADGTSMQISSDSDVDSAPELDGQPPFSTDSDFSDMDGVCPVPEITPEQKIAMLEADLERLKLAQKSLENSPKSLSSNAFFKRSIKHAIRSKRSAEDGQSSATLELSSVESTGTASSSADEQKSRTKDDSTRTDSVDRVVEFYTSPARSWSADCFSTQAAEKAVIDSTNIVFLSPRVRLFAAVQILEADRQARRSLENKKSPFISDNKAEVRTKTTSEVLAVLLKMVVVLVKDRETSGAELQMNLRHVINLLFEVGIFESLVEVFGLADIDLKRYESLAEIDYRTKKKAETQAELNFALETYLDEDAQIVLAMMFEQMRTSVEWFGNGFYNQDDLPWSPSKGEDGCALIVDEPCTPVRARTSDKTSQFTPCGTLLEAPDTPGRREFSTPGKTPPKTPRGDGGCTSEGMRLENLGDTIIFLMTVQFCIQKINRIFEGFIFSIAMILYYT